MFGTITILSFYCSADLFLNKKNADNTIFIWGDSQIYRDLDLEKLNKLTGKKILSAAKHGAGIYDFLVFSEKVPYKSNVIVAISKPVQLRRKEKDSNRSVININSLLSLYKANYSISEIIEIVNKNRKPRDIFNSTKDLYPYADSIVFTEPLSLFKEAYSKKPEYLMDKQALYLGGIKKLIKKKCEITLMEFPYHPIVEKIEENSVIKKHTENFKVKIANLFNNFKVSSIILNSSKTLMHDLTHLNEYGATKLTEQLAHRMSSKKITTLYVVRFEKENEPNCDK